MEYLDRYIFPAIFQPIERGGYTITFPDLPGIATEGDDLSEALYMAKEALELHLYGMEEDGDLIPQPTAPENVEVPERGFVTLVEAFMPLVRDEMANKVVNTNVTLPKWLKKTAEEHKINFSQVLQSALKEQLGIRDRT